MTSNRLEAFTDAVIAIIITIMVIEFEAPEETDFKALIPMIPKLLSYLLSFVFLAIYWNNHHHLFQIIDRVNGKVLWANMNVLFWLSLVPFSTSWLGEHYYQAAPSATYGILLTLISFSSFLLHYTVSLIHKDGSLLKSLSKTNKREGLTFILYVAGVALSFIHTNYALTCYAIGTSLWFLPDRRIENIYK